jgi:SP family facilitated glucose transporter-like MFS transporter 8
MEVDAELSHLNEKIDNDHCRKREANTKRQFYAAICMSLISFSYGTTCGWTSGAIVHLTKDSTPLLSGKLGMSEISWIASGIGIGGMISNLFFGWLAEKVGKKVSLYVVIVPQIFSWLFIYYARTSIYLIISRILAGFCGGGIFAIIPSYISEISDPHVRGILGSFLVLFCNSGLMFAYIIGGYVDYDNIPMYMLPFCFAFIVLFVKFPDSHASLIRRKRFAVSYFLYYIIKSCMNCYPHRPQMNHYFFTSR